MRAAFALVCLAGCAVGFAAESPLVCRTSILPQKSRPVIEDLATGHLPIPDYLTTAAACSAGPADVSGRGADALNLPPASAWLNSERARYVDVLAKRPVDLLVVPFQVQGYGLDRIERAIMTADLAYAIGDAGKLRVADPFLTAVALGEGERRFDADSIERLAWKLGAQRFLVGYVGHDLHHAFTLTLELKESAGAQGVLWRRDWRSIPFTNDKTPAYILHAMLPAVLKELPLGLAPKSVSPATAPAVPVRISGSPAQFVALNANTGSALAQLSLIGALTPREAELTRERAFERALVAAMRLDTSQPSQRL